MYANVALFLFYRSQRPSPACEVWVFAKLKNLVSIMIGCVSRAHGIQDAAESRGVHDIVHLRRAPAVFFPEGYRCLLRAAAKE